MKYVFFFLGMFCIFFQLTYYEPFPNKSTNSSLSILVDGEESSVIPKKEDGYDIVSLNCNNQANGIWDEESWNLKILNLSDKVKCHISFSQFLGVSWDFSYTGAFETFEVPQNGTYQIELWGGSGGKLTLSPYQGVGGKGAYVSGAVFLKKNDLLYFYVGGQGSNGLTNRSQTLIPGGFNGGGSNRSLDAISPGGGGATDVRLTSGSWNDFDSLKSRIMVAGAGGGSGISNTGLYGNAWEQQENVDPLYGSNGTQTVGGIAGTRYTHHSGATNGGFGFAGDGGQYGVGAGGSGYYGGGGGNHVTPRSSGGGGGGSSFISGHPGNDAISSESTSEQILHTGQPNHFSGVIFKNTISIAGNDEMPTYDGLSTMIGNEGNGYAKITFLHK